MAQKIIVQLHSDLSEVEIPQGEGSTVNFSFQGKSFEIDLSDKELAEFEEVLDIYMEKGRRANRTRSGSAPVASTHGNTGSGIPKEELQKIRAWGQENGFKVSERGRVKNDLVEAYRAAN